MNWKKTAVRTLENASGLRLVRRGTIGPLFEQDHLRRFIEHFRVDCVFDVGANVGQYAQMLRKDVGYRGLIVSFEPIPEHAQRMREMAEADASWFIEEMALDEQEGEATFNVMAGDQFSSLHEISATGAELFKEKTQLTRQIRVRTSTVAEQVAKYQAKLRFERPFLKMDTQGHDSAVVRGAAESLTKFVGLQSELAIKRLYADSPSFEESLAFYSRSGFELSALVPNNLGHFPNLLEIDCIMYRR
jgi:FkbM family methyltransferase